MRNILAVLAILASTPALAAGEWTSPWLEARFAPLSEKTIEHDGVRVTNCHLEWYNFGSTRAVPKCYVMNTSRKDVEVRVDFVLFDEAGKPVLATAMATPGVIHDMVGAELSVQAPISLDEAKRVQGGRVRVFVDGVEG